MRIFAPFSEATPYNRAPCPPSSPVAGSRGAIAHIAGGRSGLGAAATGAYKSPVRASTSLLVSLLLLPFAPACSDDGGGTSGLSVAPTTTTPATTGTSTEASTGAAPTTSGSSGPGSTSEPGSTSAAVTTTMALTSTGTSTGSSGPDTGDPECPPVKGEYNDCTDEGGKIDNKLCKWMGDGEHGFITCLNAAGLEGASTCSLVNCEQDCDCFAAPATGTARSVCRLMATDKGDNACILDCSAGATCPDGMACDNDTCFWPAP